MSENKFYSFLNGNRCVTRDGKEYIGVTTTVIHNRIERKDVNGKKLVSARAAISNRTRTVANLLGVDLPDEETLWVDVTFWEDRAERFDRFLGDRDKVRVVLCGSLSSREYERQDGTKGIGVSINVNDWMHYPLKEA